MRLGQALLLRNFWTVCKDVAREGSVHYWHTGPGGEVEPWIRQREGWERVPGQAQPGQAEAFFASFHGKPADFRRRFLEFVGDGSHLLSPEEHGKIKEAQGRRDELEKQVDAIRRVPIDPEAAGRVLGAYMEATADHAMLSRVKSERALSLLRAHSKGEIMTRPPPKKGGNPRWMREGEEGRRRLATAQQSLQKVQQFIEAGVLEGMEKKAVCVDVHTESCYLHDGHLASKYAPLYYDAPTILLNMKSDASIPDTEDDLYHEYMHHLFAQNKGVREKVKKFFRDRTAGDKVEYEKSPLVGDYPHKKDRWAELGGRDYAGRIYSGQQGDSQEGDGIEVLSCGMERFMRNPVTFAQQDPEYFELVVSCLRGW